MPGFAMLDLTSFVAIQVFGFAGADVLGSVGVALLLLAFFLNLGGRLPSDRAAYAALNTIGAGLACLASYMIDFLPFVLLEGTWCLFALWAWVRILAGRGAGAADRAAPAAPRAGEPE